MYILNTSWIRYTIVPFLNLQAEARESKVRLGISIRIMFGNVVGLSGLGGGGGIFGQWLHTGDIPSGVQGQNHSDHNSSIVGRRGRPRPTD